MNKNIVIIMSVGAICGMIGFQTGRAGMAPQADGYRYEQSVQEGIRHYKVHYFATRKKMSDLFEYIEDREKRFYREMPDSFRSKEDPPQCVIDLFGNLDKWKANYLDETKNWDSQVRDIEVQIAGYL